MNTTTNMASRTTLIKIEYHDDGDTGMYDIGEIDFGVYGEFDKYCEQYGRQGVKNILSTLNHLIWHVTEYGYKAAKSGEVNPVGLASLPRNFSTTNDGITQGELATTPPKDNLA